MAGQLGHVYGDVNLSAGANAILGDVHHHHHVGTPPGKSNYEILYQSLSFEGIHSRLRNVDLALPQTCKWLRSHPEFLQWKDDTRMLQHRGLLWLKGKPGSGKSTIMKDTLEWAQEEWSNELILSYFFNARASTELERSCLGLYRSLTYQLLSLCDKLRPYFKEEFSSKEKNKEVESWTETELQNFLLKRIGSGHLPYLNIFIDALDEGDYNDIWRMITFFERAADRSASIGSAFRLCLSSRHYPQINIEAGLTIVLEDQLGHKHDIKLYIQRTLPGKSTALMEDIRDALLRKADGIFLWVVLSISLLRPLQSRGRIAEMKKQLEILPTGLYDLFFTIMTKDTEDLDDFVTLLQWMLVRKHMLSPREIYLGTKFRDASPDLDLTVSAEDASTLTSRVLDCSKGFVEAIQTSEKSKKSMKGDTPEEPGHGVQFIHESVRQFLRSIPLTAEQSQPSRSSPFDFSLETCNLVVAQGCLHYLLHICRGTRLTTGVFHDYPLAKYVANYWWQHIQAANVSHSSRVASLVQTLLTGRIDNIFRWAYMYDIDWDKSGPHLQLTASSLPQPLYYMASIGVMALFSPQFLSATNLDAQGGKYGTALQAASAYGHTEVVKLLLNAGASIHAEGGIYGTALQAASANGRQEVVQLLMDRGANVNAQGGLFYHSALHAALACDHKHIAQFLLDQDASQNATAEQHTSALQAASVRGHTEIVQLLLDRYSTPDTLKERLLYEACEQGHQEVVQLFFEQDVNIDAAGGYYGSALQVAVAHNQKELVKLLLGRRADVRDRGGQHGSALRLVALQGERELLQFLQDAGALDRPPAKSFSNAFEAAWEDRVWAAVDILVKHIGGRSAQGVMNITVQDAGKEPVRSRDIQPSRYFQLSHYEGELERLVGLGRHSVREDMYMHRVPYSFDSAPTRWVLVRLYSSVKKLDAQLVLDYKATEKYRGFGYWETVERSVSSSFGL